MTKKTETMNAIVFTEYGGPEVFKLESRPKPIPNDDEYLVRNKATTVSSGEVRLRALNVPFGFKTLSRLMMGFTKPKHQILGMSFSGVIESQGKTCKEYQIGDEIFGSVGDNFGGYAEYLVVKEGSSTALKPKMLNHQEAASLTFGATAALNYLRDRGNIHTGQKVMIYGASGAVGTAAIQIAKYYGAEVTAVCSAANHELVKSLGADHVIDYKTEDFKTQGEIFDLVFETVGKAPYSDCKSVLKKGGKCLFAVATLLDYLKLPFINMFSSKKLLAGVAWDNKADTELIKSLVESGDYKPVIDREFELSQMTEAHTYVDSGRKRGNVVVNILHSD